MPNAPFGTIYISAAIEIASERVVVAALAKRLEQNQEPYVVIANVEIGDRQIDCVVASASSVTLIEVKASRTPVRGDINGVWARRDASGSWRPFRNGYQQAVGAKNALRDAMSAVAPVGDYYPDACVIFADALPAGSELTLGDFKARVTTLTNFLAVFPAGPAKRPPWSLDQWHAFAASLSLTAVSLDEAVGGDQVRRDLERLRLYNAAVAQEYGPAGEQWLHEEGVPDALERAASDSGGCVIVGPSGCGKTLMAAALASRLAAAGSSVLFFASKDFAGEWAKAVRREISLLTDDSPAELLRAVANGGHPVFLIVDGINELAGTEALALRGLRALARRLDAKVVLTSQGPAAGFDGLSTFEVSRPSDNLKQRIAERNGRRVSGSVADLLKAVGSGFEAEMVGDVGSRLAGEATRLALIDQYIRTRLGAHARAGAFGLRRLAVALHADVAFSMAEARFDEFMRHETVGFDVCDAMAVQPTVALSAVVHSLALSAFYPPYDRASCLEIKGSSAYLDGHAPGIDDTRAGRSIAERHERWAVRLPKEVGDLWAFIQALAATDLLDLLAHSASLTVNAVRAPFDRKPGAWAHADRLAEAVGLDMSGYWSPTVGSYLGRVTKARIGEAVREAVSEEAAARIEGLKKSDMASEAETLLAGKGWLPSLLRAPIPATETVDPAAAAEARAAA